MSSALIAIALLAGALEREPDASFGFQRVDLISEDPGTWIHYDLPYATVFPVSPALRWASQVKVVWSTPYRGLQLGTSLRSQSAVMEMPLALGQRHGLFWTFGVQSKLLLPTGVMAGLSWQHGPLRAGAGVSILSHASWSNLSWRQWQVLPTLGLGVGRSYRAPEEQ